MEIGLSLGSCLGDRLAFLRGARDAIEAIDGVRIVASAPVYETEPVGVRPEFAGLPYLNTVLILEAGPDVEALRHRLAAIEEKAGRTRGADKFAPRTLDIDVLYAGDTTLDTPTLVLPHPRWAQRRFDVQPLADVRPGLILPGRSESVAERLQTIPLTPSVRLFAQDW